MSVVELNVMWIGQNWPPLARRNLKTTWDDPTSSGPLLMKNNHQPNLAKQAAAIFFGRGTGGNVGAVDIDPDTNTLGAGSGTRPSWLRGVRARMCGRSRSGPTTRRASRSSGPAGVASALVSASVLVASPSTECDSAQHNRRRRLGGNPVQPSARAPGGGACSRPRRARVGAGPREEQALEAAPPRLWRARTTSWLPA